MHFNIFLISSSYSTVFWLSLSIFFKHKNKPQILQGFVILLRTERTLQQFKNAVFTSIPETMPFLKDFSTGVGLDLPRYPPQDPQNLISPPHPPHKVLVAPMVVISISCFLQTFICFNDGEHVDKYLILIISVKNIFKSLYPKVE